MPRRLPRRLRKASCLDEAEREEDISAEGLFARLRLGNGRAPSITVRSTDGVSVSTLYGWEQGRKPAQGAARTLVAIASTKSEDPAGGH